MAAQAPPPTPPPPPIPPGMDPSLNNYLGQVLLWANKNFATTLRGNQALPGLMLLSPGGKVFNVTVTDAGAVTTTPVVTGKGAP